MIEFREPKDYRLAPGDPRVRADITFPDAPPAIDPEEERVTAELLRIRASERGLTVDVEHDFGVDTRQPLTPAQREQIEARLQRKPAEQPPRIAGHLGRSMLE